MYYQNITHPELQEYHKVIVPNFTIKLTDALTSDLFKVETIITDSIYKVYPLFYTMEITSSNPLDKILETQCIICQKTTDETYLTFISNPDDPIKDYSNYASYFDVSDTLTTAEFNSIVSLLRHNVVNVDGIRINDSVNGVYGVYEFDISDTTILDNGIVVSDETISAEPKVRLSNPTFPNSTYTLKLSVLHFTDVNILDDDSDDYKVIETLEIELTPNIWVDIPVATLEEGYVILFDANVEIKHDKSIIQDWITQLFLTGDKPIIQTGDSEILTATALDDLENGVDGKTIYFVQKSKHFWDKGTSGSYNSNWFNYGSLTVSRDANGTTITKSATGNGSYIANVSSVYDYSFNNIPKYVAFQVDSVSSARFQIIGDNAHNVSLNANETVEVIYEDGKMTIVRDGVSGTPTTVTDEPVQVRFQMQGVSSLKYHNFIIVYDDVDSATTSNGVATNTVTGTGYGLIKNVAKFNDLESNEYEFIDSLFYDKGLSSSHNDNWTTLSNLTRYDDYTFFKGANAFYNSRIRLNNSENIPMKDYCVEFDVFDVNGARFFISDGTAKSLNLSNGHYKIYITSDGIVKPYRDGTAETTASFDSTVQTIYIGFNNSNNASYSLKFKEFVVYAPSRVEPSSVSLTGSAPVIQTGDTLTLSAKATGDGGVCTGNRIDFIQKPTSSNTWTQIGSALTDETGTAILNYTGVGQGDVDFKAKYSTLVSTPYPVIDALFYDTGTDDSKDSNYTVPSSNFQRSHSDDGAMLKSTATSGTSYASVKMNNEITWRDSNTNYQIECNFEFDNGSNGGVASVIFGNARFGLSGLVGGESTGSGHLTIVSSGDTYIIKLNGTQVGTTQNMTNTDGFRFVFYRDCIITFKDLVIYTI